MFPLIRQLHRRIRRASVYVLVLCLLILLGGGVGFWLLDPGILSLGDGLWLAFTTAATVGYGDLVPSTLASRLFSVLVFAMGLAVLSLVTASLSAMFLEPDNIGHRPCSNDDLMREIRSLQAQVQALQAQCKPCTGQRCDAT
jgi:voltage-gated potassium channel